MRRDWQMVALLAAATVAVFWRVSRHEFINYDDPAYVTHNPMVQAGLTRAGVVWAFGELHGEATYWHPVTWLSHELDCQLFGLRPAGHHLVSLFLHTLNTALLFLLLRRMTGAGKGGQKEEGRMQSAEGAMQNSGAFWRSAFVAALFALHPLQVDSVAWIAERKNLLSTFFGLLTLWAYVRFAQVQSLKSKVQSRESVISHQCSVAGGGRTTDHGPRTTHHSPLSTPHASRFTFCTSPFYLLALCFFALGLMSKPMLVTLPLVMLLLDYWPLRRMQSAACRRQNSEPGGTRHAPFFLLPSSFFILEKLPFLALSAVSSVLTIRGSESLGALVSTEQLPVPWRLANAVVACTLYLRKLVWPVDLSVFYLHPGRWPAGAVVGSALVWLGLTALALWQARRRPYLIVGWLWFLVMLLPVIGLVQAHVQALADRFTYLPAVGVFVMVVWAVAEWTAGLTRGRRVQVSLAAVALGGCVVMTSLQLRHW